MIQAMLTGEPFEGPANIPNAGQAVGLPPDVVVESICVIDGDGIRGRDRAVLPTPYDEIVRRHVATQELTIEAALTGDRVLAAEAFALDPLAGRGDLRSMEAMVDELLASTAEWLPRSAVTRREVWREHGCASDSSGSAPWGCRWRVTSSRPATR